MSNKDGIDFKIKSFKDHFGRWMRCINADDVSDYVDIHVNGGSSSEERHAILCNADFIGGKWTKNIFISPANKRTKYDYYFLYNRDEDGEIYFPTDEGKDGKFIGQDRDGYFITVNGETHEILKKWE